MEHSGPGNKRNALPIVDLAGGMGRFYGFRSKDGGEWMTGGGLSPDNSVAREDRPVAELPAPGHSHSS